MPYGYKLLLHAFLFAAAPSLCFSEVRVINAGVPGESSAEVNARLDSSLKRNAPGYVVIFVGMNDAVNDKKFLPPATTVERVTDMIRRAQGSGAKTILVSVHEPDTVRLLQRHKAEVYGNVSPTERIRNLDRLLLQAAKKNHASVADFHRSLIRAGGATQEWSTDGVHLTEKGYALLAQTIRKALPKHIPADTNVLCMGDSLTYGIGVRSAGGTEESDKTYPAVLQQMLNKDSRMP